MSETKPLHLFAGIGVELEYMIVDRETLAVRPMADEVLRAVTGSYQTAYEQEDICWSNELALHVIELKTCGPVQVSNHGNAQEVESTSAEFVSGCRVPQIRESGLSAIHQVCGQAADKGDAVPCDRLPVQDLTGTVARFQRDVGRINAILEKAGAMLMPTGSHPWMDPFCETRLWPHEQNVIYEAYDRIFDCRGHGWSNLQSAHLNFPFAGDEEFGRLHAAIRVLLPLLPALAASTPMVDLQVKGFLDYRLEVYKNNSQRIPAVTGRVVPEPVFTREEYERQIFAPMYRDIAPHDREGILQHEWLNARGAIARFDRSAIEIRILDVQECPLADLAVAALVFHTLKALVAGKWSTPAAQRRWGVEPLAGLLDRTIRHAEGAPIDDPAYAALFGLDAGKGFTAGRLWRGIFEALKAEGTLEPALCQALEVVLTHGSLASRIVSRLGANPAKPEVTEVYRELCSCLAAGRLFASDRSV